MRGTCVLMALFGILHAGPLLAQGARGELAAPACDGDIANVRLTEISPTGTMEGYLKALDAHRAWYRAHGFTNNEIFATRVMVTEPGTNKLKYSDTQVLAFHIRPPYMPGSTGHDAAWDAFHQLYRENSIIKTSYNICMPKTR